MRHKDGKKEDFMIIKESRYNEAWVDKQIDKMIELFSPVLRGNEIYRINRLMRAACWIFIITTQIFLIKRTGTHPFEAGAYSAYIFFSVICAFIVIKDGIRALTDPMRRMYKECTSAFKDLLTGFYEIKENYHFQDSIQKNMKALAMKDPKKLLDKFRSEQGVDIEPDFAENGTIAFSGLDDEAEQYMELVHQLEETCRKNGLLR